MYVCAFRINSGLIGFIRDTGKSRFKCVRRTSKSRWLGVNRSCVPPRLKLLVCQSGVTAGRVCLCGKGRTGVRRLRTKTVRSAANECVRLDQCMFWNKCPITMCLADKKKKKKRKIPFCGKSRTCVRRLRTKNLRFAANECVILDRCMFWNKCPTALCSADKKRHKKGGKDRFAIKAIGTCVRRLRTKTVTLQGHRCTQTGVRVVLPKHHNQDGSEGSR